jgi:hypothetical protein
MGSIPNTPSVPQVDVPLSIVQVLRFVLTPAQFLTLDNTFGNAITLIPGLPGNIIELLSISVNLQFPAVGGVAYATGTGNLQFAYNTGAALLVIASTIGTANIKSGSSIYNFNEQAGSGGDLNVSVFSGTPVVVAVSTAVKYTAGNSGFIITLRYRYVPVV